MSGDAVKDLVDQSVHSHKVTVFSKSYCPYSKKVKSVLKKYDINDIAVVELDEREECEQIQDYLAKLTGARTVPRLFINGTFVGGGDDTTRLDENGKLKVLLEECGALNVTQ